MPKRNATGHPFQVIRLVCDIKQAEFAVILGISLSALTKHETYRAGEVPNDLRRRIFSEFGAVIYPGPIKNGRLTYRVEGFDHEPFTKDYWQKHRRECVPLVKYPPADVVKGVDVAARLCTILKRENQFAEAVASGLKGLCNSERFKIALKGEVKKLLKANEVLAAAWLCTLLDDAELRRALPQLPTIIESHLKDAKKLKAEGYRHVYFNGKPV